MSIQQSHRDAVSPEADDLYVVNQHGHYFRLKQLRVDRGALEDCRLFDNFDAMKSYLVAEHGYDPDDIVEGDSPLLLTFNPEMDAVVEEDVRGIVTPLDDTIERYISQFEL